MVLLDVGLPDMDGTEVCRRMRSAHDWTPVLFVTARDDEVDRVLGLELGADDYVTKPFSPRELVARVRVAVLRRAAGATSAGGRLGFAGVPATPIDTARSEHHDQLATALQKRLESRTQLATFLPRRLALLQTAQTTICSPAPGPSS